MTTVILLVSLLTGVDAGPGAANLTAARRYWVFFTDKAVRSSQQYQAALDAAALLASPASVQRRAAAPVRGFDYDDLPVSEQYLRAIEQLGGRLHMVSRWLNAASFTLSPTAADAVSLLPFVRKVTPVAKRTLTTDAFPIQAFPVDDRHRATDTAKDRRFYGPSYEQARMMGVPEVAARGYTGSGVRLAMFDSGLRLYNRAVARIRLGPQRDFLSGDNYYQAQSVRSWAATPIDQLRYLGLVAAPSLVEADTLLTGARPLLAVFCADSFAYGYNPPRRMLFATHSSDHGTTWSTARPIYACRPYDQTVENTALAVRRAVSYLAFNDLTETSGRATSNLYLGWFVGTDWGGAPRFLGAGRWPSLAIAGDTLYIAFVRSDSALGFAKYLVSDINPVLLTNVTVTLDQRVSQPQVAVGSDNSIDIVCVAGDALRYYRSRDGGETFSLVSEPVAAAAHQPQLLRFGDTCLLFWRNEATLPCARLSLLRSTDGGQSWFGPVSISDTLLPAGGFSAALSPDGLDVAWLSAGRLYRSRSTNLGADWQPPALLDSSGFATLPRLVSTEQGPMTTWLQRGDATAVWEPADTLRFSREQPHHGTRMASIIAGYQPGGVVGVAPGVELLVARTELFKVRSGRYYEYNLEEDTYIEALEWAERVGADIVSTSLGYRSWYDDSQFDGHTAPVSIAADRAARRGMLIVTAMGNRDTTIYPWPRPYIVAPGDAENVVTAGGVQKSLVPWRGTGTGPTADGRIKPDLVALSDTVAVASPDSLDWLDGSVGTSCATALIAGAAALLKEAHPNWTAESIKVALYSTATLSVKSCTFGFGVPRIDSAFKRYPPAPDNQPITRDAIATVFPNPFITGEHDRVWFGLNIRQPQTEAEIAVYTASGSLVRVIPLDAGRLPRPGRYTSRDELEPIGAYWDGKNSAGQPCAAGLYMAVLRTTFGNHTTRFALVR